MIPIRQVTNIPPNPEYNRVIFGLCTFSGFRSRVADGSFDVELALGLPSVVLSNKLSKPVGFSGAKNVGDYIQPSRSQTGTYFSGSWRLEG
jgi:hypothetical protein